MSDMDGFKVVMVRATEGATIRKLAKGEHYNPYVKYTHGIVYVLDDGREFPSNETYDLLRDAKAGLAALPSAPKVPTFAKLTDDESKVSIISRHYGALIGGRS